MKIVLLGKYVSTQSTADDVSQMRHIVDIRQSGCDKNVLLALFRNTFNKLKIDEMTIEKSI